MHTTEHPFTHLPLAQALDETAFECGELLWSMRRDLATDQMRDELADQLRALAERLQTHGGAG